MDENQIKELLDRLGEIRAQQDVIRLQKQEVVDSVLTLEIKQKLAEIDAEFAQKTTALTENMTAAEAQVKEAVSKLGHSVKGTHLHAVYSKGRSGGWDSDKLLGYSIAHPEILVAKKPDGEPSVSIRSV